jgi:hypothetical protein
MNIAVQRNSVGRDIPVQRNSVSRDIPVPGISIVRGNGGNATVFLGHLEVLHARKRVLVLTLQDNLERLRREY